MKRYLAENEINFYIINGTKTGQELGLGNRTNTIMVIPFLCIHHIDDIADKFRTVFIVFDLVIRQVLPAAIRPFLMSDEELAAAPAGTQAKPAIGKRIGRLINSGFRYLRSTVPVAVTVPMYGPGQEPKSLVMRPLGISDGWKENRVGIYGIKK